MFAKKETLGIEAIVDRVNARIFSKKTEVFIVRIVDLKLTYVERCYVEDKGFQSMFCRKLYYGSSC